MSNLKPTFYIDELVRITKELVEHIHDVSYEEVEHFTNVREELVKKIEPLATELSHSDKEKIRTICSYDKTIIDKISALKDEASQWLSKRSAIKEQKSAYRSIYAADSMFIDLKN